MFVAIAALGAAACGDKKAKPAEQAAKAVGSNAVAAGSGSGSGSGAGSGSATAADANEPVLYNRLDVERFEDEKPVDHVKLTVKVPKVAAYRTFPGGATVAVLPRGTEVVQLASRSGFDRVTFTDPERPERRLVGWVGSPAFEDPPKLDKPFPAARCTILEAGPGTQVYALEDHNRAAVCEYVCKDPTECDSTGGKCELRMFIDKSGAIPDVWQYTTVCPVPNIVPNGPPLLVGNQPPFNGHCPFNEITVPKFGHACYRTCKKDVDCPQGTTCRTFPELKVKAKLCSA